MEDDLDKVADGNRIWYELLNKFWTEFEPMVKEAFSSMEKVAPEETGETCPECGGTMVFRKGKYGKFEACSNYPDVNILKKPKK